VIGIVIPAIDLAHAIAKASLASRTAPRVGRWRQRAITSTRASPRQALKVHYSGRERWSAKSTRWHRLAVLTNEIVLSVHDTHARGRPFLSPVPMIK